ncbi:hypothetical protein FOZ61_000204 [Perkinsus olseni]|uniref:Uncharacterized protein n=1 Tax=Perkinsus olseni TaxID=32597 RepID=A0A7J6M0Q1_PEROL|nr:hypothetical protein FOZ61_000204 [Perkinsus olseni]
MNSLLLSLLGCSSICYAYQGVEWLFGKRRNGDKYYLSPTAGDRGQSFSMKQAHGGVGPFESSGRFLIGYRSKSMTPVATATVYVVPEDKPQRRYTVAVNSGVKRSPCFSEIVTSSGAGVDGRVLKDLNEMCENDEFDLLQARDDPNVSGRYFGAISPERTLEVDLKHCVPVNATASGIESSTLLFMPVEGRFLFVKLVDSNETRMVLPKRGDSDDQERGSKRIGWSNLDEWDTAATPKPKMRMRRFSPLSSPYDADDENSI